MARGAKRLWCTSTPAALCGLFAAVLLAGCADAAAVNSYVALSAAAAAGGSYTVTGNIVWPASGTLTLSNVSLALTGACTPTPCVLNASALGGHFRVLSGANLSLTSVSVVNSKLVASNNDCYSFSNSVRLPACGAVTVAGGSFAASNTVFSNNVVQTNGGSTAWGSALAFYVVPGSTGVTLHVKDCIFQGNSIIATTPGSTRTGGGAVAVFDQATVAGSITKHPSPTLNAPPVHAPFVFENTQFLGNFNTQGGQGGALWIGIAYGQVIVRSCTFSSNYVTSNSIVNTGRGGALFFGYVNRYDKDLAGNFPSSSNDPSYGDHAWLTLQSNNFTNNRAITATFGAPSQGGAVFLDHFSGRVDITNCNYLSNSAFTGGAVYYVGSTAMSYNQLANVPFSSGTLPAWASSTIIGTGASALPASDYADYNFGVAGFLQYDYFSLEPVADETGYALSITGSNFTSNVATGGAAAQAGALYIACGAVNLLSTTFQLNSAPCGSLGGAVLATNGCPSPDLLSTRVSLTQCTLSGNSAGALSAVQAGPMPGAGGVLVTLTASTLSNNWDAACPTACGSAAFVAGAAAFLASSGSIFANHSSTVNGSAVCLTGGATGTSSADTFVSNAASSFGGALYADADSTCVVAPNTTYTNNSATVGGCAFFGSDSPNPPTLTVLPSAGNQATNYGSVAATAPASFRLSVGGPALSAAVNGSYSLLAASGKPPSLAVTLLDAYGMPVNYWQDFMADVICVGCPAGALGGATHAVYFSSAAAFPTLTLSGTPGAVFNLSLVLVSPSIRTMASPGGLVVNVSVVIAPCAALETFDATALRCLCQPGAFLNSVSGQCTACVGATTAPFSGAATCSACPPATVWIDASTACVSCPFNSAPSPYDPARCACSTGYYDTLFGDYAAAPACAMCPLGGECTTGFVGASAGYWRSNQRSDKFYRCREGNCLHEAVTGPLSAPNASASAHRHLLSLAPLGNFTVNNCVNGSVGPLCGVCLPGYARQSGECAVCAPGDAWANWSQQSKAGLLVGCLIFALIFIAFTFFQPLSPTLERLADAFMAGCSSLAERIQASVKRCMCGASADKTKVADTKKFQFLGHGEEAQPIELRSGDEAATQPSEKAETAAGQRPVRHRSNRIDEAAMEHSLAANAAFAAGNVIALATQLDGGMEEEDTGEGERGAVEAQTDMADRLDELISQIKGFSKIFINFYQILSTFLRSLDVPWPAAFVAAMTRVNVVNINLVQLPAAACLNPSPSYYREFLGYTLGLLVALLSILALWFFGHAVVAPITLRGASAEQRASCQAQFNTTLLSRMLLLLYLVYPGVSVAIFAVFSCTELDGAWYLDADLRLTCYDSQHWRYIGGAIAWLFFVPLGIPAFFIWLLHRFKVPQMAALMTDNAWLREAVKLAWAEGLVQPPGAALLTVESISTLHLEALHAFFLQQASTEEAAEILAGTRSPAPSVAGVEKAAGSSGLGAIKLRVLRALQSLAGRTSVKAAPATCVPEGPERRAFLLAALMQFARTSDQTALPPLFWYRPDEAEAIALTALAPDAAPHASGVRCADLPELAGTALNELSFLFAAYRIDCWYWEVVELIRKLALTSILALIAPGSAGQVVCGLLMAFFTLLATMGYTPYVHPSLNLVAKATQANLFFLLLVALLLKLNADGEGDSFFFSGIVSALCVLPVAMPVLLRLYMRFGGGGLEARALMRDNEWAT